jgi:hypothetical protein
MSNSRLLTATLFCLILILGGCTSKQGPTAEEEKLFVEAYVRVALAAQDHRDHTDSLAARREAVLREVGLDEGQFFSLARKIEASPERWAVIWEQIVERVRKEGGEEGD